jgi:hypothetical protein
MRTLVGVVAVVAVAGAVALWNASDDDPVTPAPTPLATASCDTGPWAEHCPEADWARDVADAAGFEVTGDTGSALTVERQGLAFHLWAFTPEEPELRRRQLRQERYRTEATIGGVRVFGDTERLTWDAYGLHVYMASGGLGALDVGVPGVADIVRASTRVRWP